MVPEVSMSQDEENLVHDPKKLSERISQTLNTTAQWVQTHQNKSPGHQDCIPKASVEAILMQWTAIGQEMLQQATIASPATTIDDRLSRLETQLTHLIKTTEQQTRPQAPPGMSYARAAAGGVTPPTPPLTRGTSYASTTRVPTPNDDLKSRTVIVRMKNSDSIHKLRNKHLVQQKEAANTAIQRERDAKKETLAVSLLSMKQLKSGDVQVTTATAEEAKWLRSNVRWAGTLGGGAEVIKETYGVVVHGIPIKEANMDNKSRVIDDIVAYNSCNIPNLRREDIRYVGWLKLPKKDQEHTSMVVEFKETAQADWAIHRGLLWVVESKSVDRYIKSWRVKQCFKCLQHGHISSQCQKKDQICGKCAKPHAESECPSDSVKKCAVCSGSHHAKDRNKCPILVQHAEKVRQMQKNGTEARYWDERNLEAMRQPQTQIFTESFNFSAGAPPKPVQTTSGKIPTKGTDPKNTKTVTRTSTKTTQGYVTSPVDTQIFEVTKKRRASTGRRPVTQTVLRDREATGEDRPAASAVDGEPVSLGSDDAMDIEMGDETVVSETVVNEAVVNETAVNETVVSETVVNETVVNETAVNDNPTGTRKSSRVREPTRKSRLAMEDNDMEESPPPPDSQVAELHDNEEDSRRGGDKGGPARQNNKKVTIATVAQ
jgi:hypothetical protein